MKSSEKLSDTRTTAKKSKLRVIIHTTNMIIKSITNTSLQDFASNG